MVREIRISYNVAILINKILINDVTILLLSKTEQISPNYNVPTKY